MSTANLQTWEDGCRLAVSHLRDGIPSTQGSLEGFYSAQDWIGVYQCAYASSTPYIGAYTREQEVRFLAGKQHDYGPENVLKFGIDGLKVRLWDKIARVNNLLARGGDSVNESLGDSYIDLMGYCVLITMLKHDTFKLPLAADLAVKADQDVHYRAVMDNNVLASGDSVIFVDAESGVCDDFPNAPVFKMIRVVKR